MGNIKDSYTKKFMEMWRSDSGLNLHKYSYSSLRRAILNCNPYVLMTEKELSILKGLPDLIPIFRGNSSDLTLDQIKESFCWTTHPYHALKMGCWHASQKNLDIKICRAFINKKFVYCLWDIDYIPNTKRVFELIADPKYIFSEQLFHSTLDNPGRIIDHFQIKAIKMITPKTEVF